MSPSTGSGANDTISLAETLTVLQGAWRLVVMTVVVVGLVTYAVVSSQAKVFTATAVLIFDQNVEGQQVTGGANPLAGATGGVNQQQTFVDLLTQGPMAAQTAKAIGGDQTASAVRRNVSASAEDQSNLLQLSAAETNPALAARVANTYAQFFIHDQLLQAQQSFAPAQAEIQHQIAQLPKAEQSGSIGATLASRSQTLADLEQLQADNVQLVQPASVPKQPSGPHTKRTVLVATVVGLFLSLLVIFARNRLDQKIRDPTELQALYSVPLLTAVPDSPRLVDGRGENTGLRELFKILRAQLRYFNVARELKVITVVSAVPAEGKTTVALNLALAAADAGDAVLLLECDLRRPTFRERLPLTAPDIGLASVLVGDAPLTAAVQTLGPDKGAPSSRPDVDGFASLDVLPADTTLPFNPNQLLESAAMRTLLLDLRTSYDLIVIDTPPLMVVPDAFPLLGQSDGVLLVGRLHRNNRSLARRLSDMLAGLDVDLLGVVANGVRQRAKDHVSYSYYRNAPDAPGPITSGKV